jgi:hypothetical protein
MDERRQFLDVLLDRCSDYGQACLTLTAIHPDGRHTTPSQHIPLDDTARLSHALAQLDRTNALGWGAYFAVGLRRPGLTRWQRGGRGDVAALPALFVDVDDPSPEALNRLRTAELVPSCVVASGGGYHAYWWLDEPTTDLHTAQWLLRGLGDALGGDRLSVAQSMRLPGTINTKPSRDRARCHPLTLSEYRYRLRDFAAYLPRQQAPRPQTPTRCVPNADLIAYISQELVRRGGRLRGDWVNGACPFPERHTHGDAHPSFGFNTRTGYGYCHVCGTLLLKDLCPALLVQDVSLERATSPVHR